MTTCYLSLAIVHSFYSWCLIFGFMNAVHQMKEAAGLLLQQSHCMVGYISWLCQFQLCGFQVWVLNLPGILKIVSILYLFSIAV